MGRGGWLIRHLRANFPAVNTPAAPFPSVSVIIPTYNRPKQIINTLASLAAQTIGPDQFEVIVVDDGSNESYAEVIGRSYGYSLRFIQQKNAGEAVARNTGARHARGRLLAFLDDDILVEPGYLQAMYDEHLKYPLALLIAELHLLLPEKATPFQQWMAEGERNRRFGEVEFTEVLAGVLAVPAEVFLALRGMQPVPDTERGRWIDIDYSYRAYLAGIPLRRCAGAVAYHDDYASADLATACRRMFRVSHWAPGLFQVHPGLRPHLAMFQDKLPVSWDNDPPRMLLAKLARPVASSRPVVWALNVSARLLENHFPSKRLLGPLYRWIISAHVFRGFRHGLKDYRDLPR